ncbi:MAG: flagellar biosynthesis regulator FlaF [Cypionkella sp.]|nr:flagellar biosynthesis regulator FlaF [Cypionkella sp.]
MNAFARSRPGYAGANASLHTPRALEYDVLARATRQLVSASAQRKTRFAALVSAIHDNETVWRTLAVDVADKGNALPAPLRAQVFYLYEFVTQHGAKVLREDASCEVLIDINTAIMRGLRGERGEA